LVGQKRRGFKECEGEKDDGPFRRERWNGVKGLAASRVAPRRLAAGLLSAVVVAGALCNEAEGWGGGGGVLVLGGGALGGSGPRSGVSLREQSFYTCI
jgi:hypothetical protein